MRNKSSARFASETARQAANASFAACDGAVDLLDAWRSRPRRSAARGRVVDRARCGPTAGDELAADPVADAGELPAPRSVGRGRELGHGILLRCCDESLARSLRTMTSVPRPGWRPRVGDVVEPARARRRPDLAGDRVPDEARGTARRARSAGRRSPSSRELELLAAHAAEVSVAVGPADWPSWTIRAPAQPPRPPRRAARPRAGRRRVRLGSPKLARRSADAASSAPSVEGPLEPAGSRPAATTRPAPSSLAAWTATLPDRSRRAEHEHGLARPHRRAPRDRHPAGEPGDPERRRRAQGRRRPARRRRPRPGTGPARPSRRSAPGRARRRTPRRARAAGARGRRTRTPGTYGSGGCPP